MTSNLSLSAPVLEVRDVAKTYRVWHSPAHRLLVPLVLRLAAALAWWPGLAERLRQFAARRHLVHDALRGVSFTLGPGESLGVIGANGSGKSTLLQIVAGVLPPSSGSVKVSGRVAALLELGAGFNPELTGRENVRINAAILGLDDATLRQRLPDIIAFADIGAYIDHPVKTYSTGMAMRLAFAVQVHTDPEILIVDEALAVGDAAFQAKAMARIDEILQRGTTLLFVGHDLNAVKAFCQRAILLESGRVVHQGLPDDVITEYLFRAHAGQRRAGTSPARLPDGYQVGDVAVTQATINGVAHAEVRYGAPLHFAFRIESAIPLDSPVFIVDILDTKGLQICGRRIRLVPAEESLSPGSLVVNVRLHATFQRGIYRIRTRIAESRHVDTTTVVARQEGRLSFEIPDDRRECFTGLYPVPMDVEIERTP